VGVANPVLDGNHGSSAHCATAACNGPVLTVGTPPGQLGAAGSPPAEAGTPALNVFAQIQGITIEDADSALQGSTGGESGGMMVSKGANITVTNARFLHNHANDGGGIDNPLGGTVTVSHSTFVSNSVTYGGGAIGNGLHGSGTLAVSGSTFSLNSASAGGAIATAFEGSGTVTVAGSTFSHNTVSGNGGAINGSTGAILWSRTFGTPFKASTIGCSDLKPYIGSTSTPVVRRSPGSVSPASRATGSPSAAPAAT